MRTPTAPIFVLTFVLVACSPEGSRIPSAPSAPSLSASGGAAAAPIATAIHGTLRSTETSTPQPAPPAIPTGLSTQMQGTGTASHLGQYTVVASLAVDLATASSSGVMTFTAANGDSFTVTQTGQAVFMNGFAQITEIASITSGTGRFSQATGTLTIVRQEDPATGVSSGTVDGTIYLMK
jgi:hypothetical protein